MSKRSARRPVPPTARGGRQQSAKPPASTRGARRPLRHWALGASLLAAVVVAVAIYAGSQKASTPTIASGSSAQSSATAQLAPDGTYSTLTGLPGSVSALRGHATLLWFVTTWCSSCQAGTPAMRAQIPKLAAHHVQVVELELAGALGQAGPPMTEFASQLAGGMVHDPAWTFGTASPTLTRTYDPNGYLDIYYLLTPSGRVAYINSSPAATMGALLNAVDKMTQHA